MPPKAFRGLVLVLIGLAMFGNYYVYDSISPLADVLKAQLVFPRRMHGPAARAGPP